MIRKYGLCAVWTIATVASFGTLYYSEIAQIAPNALDWFARVCLYPLVIIAGLASWYGDYPIARYLLPLTFIGLGISLYHIFLQETSWIPYLPDCAMKTAIGLGPISLPMLSALAFLLMSVLLILIWRTSKKGSYAKE